MPGKICLYPPGWSGHKCEKGIIFIDIFIAESHYAELHDTLNI